MLKDFQESVRWPWHHPRLQEKERDGERDINKIEDDEVDSQENRDWSPFFPDRLRDVTSHPASFTFRDDIVNTDSIHWEIASRRMKSP